MCGTGRSVSGAKTSDQAGLSGSVATAAGHRS